MASPRSSLLLVREAFASQSPDFVPVLRNCCDQRGLAGFAEQWIADHRPWAHQQIIAYLDAGLDSPGHQGLVKRLYKAAEARRDDLLMGAFLVAFDRLVRRVRRQRWSYDYRHCCPR